MKSTNKIRPLALALIERDDKFLVFQAPDLVKKEEFYRPLGGGIEFGENSREALKREIKEEIDVEVENLGLLDVFENIFTYEGIKMHEIIFLYKAHFCDKNLYKIESFDIIDSKEGRKAVWVDKELLKTSIFYPDGIKKFI